MSRQWTKPLEWSNEGAEPSATLKGTGFVGGYKPPAGVFNYAFNKNQTCIEELQTAVDDVDNNIATIGTNKQDKITGAATTIAKSNLTANRALVSNSSGKVAVSDITTTELGYLDGVTSNVQTQLDSKSASSHTHNAATTSANGFMSSTDKAKLNGIESGANKTTVDSELSSTSTNPVQNKVINTALAGKAASVHTHTAADVGAATANDITSAINAIEIGSRNLLLNTKSFSTTSSTALNGALMAGVPLVAESYRNLSVRSTTLTASTADICRYNITDFNLGDTFTFSFYAKGDITELRAFFHGSTGYVEIAKCANSQGEISTQIDGRTSFFITSEWQRYWITWKLKNTGDVSVPKYVMLRAYNSVEGQSVSVCGLKLEKGNKATDWTPSPEDLATADHTHATATTSTDGFLSSTDKKLIDDLCYGGYLTADNISITSTYEELGTSVNSFKTKSTIGKIYLGHSQESAVQIIDTTYGNANSEQDGLLSSQDKTNLDNVASAIKLVEGESLSPTVGTAVTAGTGATILNDLRTRTYGDGTALTGNVATGEYSLAEGYCTTASRNYSHAEGLRTSASGGMSHAEGNETTASGDCSHAEGTATTASGVYSHSEGSETIASGSCSHTEGLRTSALGGMSHAEGNETTASGACSHAEGQSTTASGYASHAAGLDTIANNYQTAIGKFNVSSAGATGESDTTGDVFIIGKGTSDTDRSNALRVTTAGRAYGNGAFGSSGADYAEMFEYADKNENSEDRRGLFVTLDGEKIRVANAEDDYILGVVSAAPCIVGDVQSEEWKDRYMRDVFGEKITETVEIEETTDENGVIIPAHTEVRYVINPEYNSEQKYTSRDNRKEWAAVGMIGKLVVVDDGTCQVNGYCKPDKDGKATAAETGYRVMSRIDKTHIRILFK